MYIYQTIGPLPSSKNPHFQNKAKCTAFIVKMSLRIKNISISKAEHLTYIYVVLIQRPVLYLHIIHVVVSLKENIPTHRFSKQPRSWTWDVV